MASAICVSAALRLSEHTCSTWRPQKRTGQSHPKHAKRTLSSVSTALALPLQHCPHLAKLTVGADITSQADPADAHAAPGMHASMSKIEGTCCTIALRRLVHTALIEKFTLFFLEHFCKVEVLFLHALRHRRSETVNTGGFGTCRCPIHARSIVCCTPWQILL